MTLSDAERSGWLVPKHRRVVLIADLVESVRLMQQHEAETIGRWRGFVAAARDQIVPSHGGRMVRTAGDGLLIEADKAAGAVRMAFALHRVLCDLSADQPAEERMRLRIGVHAAEIVIEDHDLQGAGVNLAARLGTLAPPGGTVVSDTVRGELGDGVDAFFVDLGLRFLKGLDAPVRAFEARPPSAAEATGLELGVPAPAADALLPAVAVIPFVAIPSDAAGEALGHALADEIIASLSRHPALRVIARVSTAALVGHPPGGERLQSLLAQAPFVLSGHCYPRGSRTRVTMELADLRTSQVIWSDASNVDVDALFQGHDDLVPHVVDNVARRVSACELSRVRALPMDALEPYSLFLGGLGLMTSLARADFVRARQVFEHLIERYPRQPAPYAMVAQWYVGDAVQGWSARSEAAAGRAVEAAHRALELNGELPLAWLAQAMTVHFFLGDTQQALRDCRRALATDPQNAQAWALLSELQGDLGDAEAALESAGRAIAISPLDPEMYLFESYAARAAVMCQRYELAVCHARASLRRNLQHAPSHRLAIGALWLSGQVEEARAARDRFLQVLPGSRVFHGQRPGVAAAGRGRFSEALLAAGVPP